LENNRTQEEIFRFLGENAYLIGPFLGCVILFFLAKSVRRQLLIDNLPTSKVKGVFIGFVQVEGTSESRTPLVSYLAEIPCVYYSAQVSEHYRRVYTVTVTDSNGKSRSETRVDQGWTPVFSQNDMQSFELEDETGRILVNPAGADIEARTVFSQTVGRGHPLYYGKGPANAVAYSTGQRSFTEEAIPLDFPLTIVGNAHERSDVVQPMLSFDEKAPFYLISTRREQEIVRSLELKSGFMVVGAIIVAVAGFMIREYVQVRIVTWQNYWPHFLISLFVALGVRAVLQINGIIEVRARVQQGFGVLDTQLKRRYDLIPNLVEVTKTFTEYEQLLQVKLNIERQDRITLNQPMIRALSEKYPELRSSAVYLKLQKELIDTEDRIALARAYCVQIVTNYNIQLEKFPSNVLASIARLKMAQPPEIISEGLERETPTVRI
jgi:hypothetical protein